MCGIFGAFAFADQDPEQLTRPVHLLAQRMARRGPDDEGEWSDGKRCALAFRRLAILDLSPSGHQPMCSSDGRYVLVFNGEIYNFRELRRDLEAKGRVFRSTGDTETLLNALAEWGTGALDRLNGMFAFACYDTAQQRLLLARDHAGMKPLHYAVSRNGLVFGSQYSDVIAHPWVRDARPARGSLGLYLRLGFVPAPWGLHEGARQVEAGEWVQIDAHGAETRGRHFRLRAWQEPTLSGRDATDAFDDVFGRAVRRHLESDVPVGVLLSGGIDSPLVAAETARQHASGLRMFSVAIGDTRFDESADARRYAAEIGVEHVVERIEALDATRLVDDVAQACTEPTSDYSMFPTLLVSQIARRHVKVVLSGDGGDELYWGYARRFGPAIAQARYLRFPRPVRLAAAMARRAFQVGAATREIATVDTFGALFLRKHAALKDDALAHLFPDAPAMPPEFDGFDFEATDTDRAAQWARWNEFHIHLVRVLAKVDRASMYHSLEVRVPLLDREVIEVAWRTDWRTCLDVDRRIGKRVLRAALGRRLKYQTTGKKGFTVPMFDWLVGPLRPLIGDELFRRRELMGLELRPGAVEQLHARLCAGKRGLAVGLWSLLSLVLWERVHGRGLAS